MLKENNQDESVGPVSSSTALDSELDNSSSGDTFRASFSLGKKLVLGFGCLILLSLILSFVAVSGTKHISEAWNKSHEVGVDIAGLAKDAKIELLQAMRYEKDFLLNYEREGVEVAKNKYIEIKEKKDIEKLTFILEELIQKSQDAGLVENQRMAEEALSLLPAYREEVQKMVLAVEEAARLKQSLVGNEEVEKEIRALRDMAKIIEKDVTEIDKQGQIIEKEYMAEALSLIGPVRNTIFITAFLIVLIGVVSSLLISRSIITNLQILVGSMTDVAKRGDLTKETTIRSSDEIGFLSKALNNMRRSLVNVITKIQQASLQVTTTSNQILAAASQQASTSTEQTSQINQLQATFTQQAATASELGQSSQEVAKFAQDAANVSKEGTQIIEDTNVKIKSLNESNEDVFNKLKILNEKVEGIGKMLTTILGVADQTNLLSLNAAIEASKAGEQGKGFSVVAQEIRRLADQTAQSSKEISNVINEIRTSSSGALMAMERSSKDVVTSTELVNNLSSRFLGINDRVQQILTQVEGMTRGVQEQSAGSKQASSALAQMSDGVRLSAEAAKQSKKAAVDMTSMSQQLRDAVGQFRLK